MKIAIIGWGSLLWDDRPQFDQHHGQWYFDGPRLPVEFARISVRRAKALTLVLEDELGAECPTAYCLSHRDDVHQAIEDLQIREGAQPHEIGGWCRIPSTEVPLYRDPLPSIDAWARQTDFDYVLWTWLPNNFEELSPGGVEFSLTAAEEHLRSLDDEGQAKAAEYIFRAPDFVHTPLRQELESKDWFRQLWEQVQAKSS